MYLNPVGERLARRTNQESGTRSNQRTPVAVLYIYARRPFGEQLIIPL